MHILAADSNPLEFLTVFGVEWNFFFGQVLSFALMAAALYYFAIKPVMKVSGQRRAEIQKGLDDAAAAAESLKNAEENASRKIAEAAAEGAKIISKAKDDAKLLLEKAREQAAEDTARAIKEADGRIERECEKMRESFRGEIADLVTAATKKVIGEVLDEKTRSALAEISAKKLSEK